MGGIKSAGDVPDAIDNLIGGAIAAGGDDGLKPAVDGLGGQFAGLARLRCGPPHAVWKKTLGAGAKNFRLLSSRRGVEDDAGLHRGP